MEQRFIAYYRVSTKAQGQSGLGLDAQKQIVLNFIHHNGNKLVSSFTEIESGKVNTRPALLEAIKTAKDCSGVLVIAKLDRLSRNVSFIANLMESKVSFIACDIPEATPLTLHIFSAMAEFERARISERTKDALQAKMRREPDFKWSTNNLTDAGRLKGHESISKNARTDINVRKAYHYICSLKEQGYTYSAISDALNLEGYCTRKGFAFHPSQVRSIMERFTVK